MLPRGSLPEAPPCPLVPPALWLHLLSSPSFLTVCAPWLSACPSGPCPISPPRWCPIQWGGLHPSSSAFTVSPAPSPGPWPWTPCRFSCPPPLDPRSQGRVLSLSSCHGGGWSRLLSHLCSMTPALTPLAPDLLTTGPPDISPVLRPRVSWAECVMLPLHPHLDPRSPHWGRPLPALL